MIDQEKRLFLIKLIICYQIEKNKIKTETKSKKLLPNKQKENASVWQKQGIEKGNKRRRGERKEKRNDNIFPFTCLVCTKMEKKKRNIYIYIYIILH